MSHLFVILIYDVAKMPFDITLAVHQSNISFWFNVFIYYHKLYGLFPITHDISYHVETRTASFIYIIMPSKLHNMPERKCYCPFRSIFII